MAKDPAILFYTGDFLNGCTDLTFEERGQYITILCLQHQKGHLSEKTIRLCVGSVSPDVLKKLTKDENGNYYNERMEAEIKKRSQFIDSRYFNGKKGGRPTKPNSKPNSKANSKAKDNLPEDDNENRDEYINNKELESIFEIFRKDYPGTKRGFEIEYSNLTKKHEDWKEIIPTLSDKLNYQKACRAEKEIAGGFIPEWKNLQTWINQRCWDEEIATNNLSNGINRKNNGATPDEIMGAVARGLESARK